MRAAVIGAGRMGRRHIQAVQECGLEVTGVFDKAPEALALAAKERSLSSQALFSDLSTMFREAAPECVVVATTTDSHHPFTLEAVRAGAKYIVCEKPMASSLAECDAMIEACREHGARLAINHHFRFSELHLAAKQALQSDSLGGVTSATVVAGNVGMAMIGTHLFELFSFISGEMPFEVTAWLSPAVEANPRGAQFQDPGGSIRFTTASGKRFYLEAGSDQGHGVMVTYGAKHGQLILDLLGGSVRILRRQDADRGLTSTRYGTSPVQSVDQFPLTDAVRGTRDVLQSLISGTGFPSGLDGKQAVAVLVAGYISDENGHRPVRLDDPTLPMERVFPWA